MSTLYEKTLKAEEERFRDLYDKAAIEIEDVILRYLLVGPGASRNVYAVTNINEIKPFEKDYFVGKLIATLNEDDYFANYTFSDASQGYVTATVTPSEPMIKPAGHLS